MPIPKIWRDETPKAEFAFMNEWKERMAQEDYGTGGPLIKNTQIKVDKYSLDKWVAEGAGLDL